MPAYGQVIDDYPTPKGRYVVVWDLVDKTSCYGAVEEYFDGTVGSLVVYERTPTGITVHSIKEADLPASVAPLIDPPARPADLPPDKSPISRERA